MGDESLAALSDDELIDEVTTLATQIAAATCRFLLVVAEMQRRGVHADWGCKTMAHWLSWRCSLSPTAAREHVRVAQALDELPLTTAAFARGELSYSKVRALVRVATPDREADLVELARTATAAQLETMIRATVAAAHDPARRDELRRLTLVDTDETMSALHAQMGVDERRLIEQALDAAVTQLPGDSAESPLAARRVDALVRICESYLATGDRSRTGPERHGVVIHLDITASGVENPTLDDGTPLDAATASQIACDATRYTIVHGTLEPLGSGRTSYEPSRAMRRAIKRRSRGRCEWSGCNQRAYIELHHIIPWETGGPTEWWNLAALCWHHHRLIHHHGYRIVLNRSTATLTCSKPDGTIITNPQPTQATEPLDAAQQPDAVVPLWRGEHFDLDACVTAVMNLTGLTNGSTTKMSA